MKRTEQRDTVYRSFPVVMLISITVLVLLAIVDIGTGKVYITPSEIIAALGQQPVESFQRQIVWELRLPRVLIALVAGAMLGLSGAILQSITLNPLAEPGITGVSAGCVVFIVLSLFIFPETASRWLPVTAIIGGLCIGGFVYALNWGRSSPARLALFGVLVSTVIQSCTSLILLRHNEALGGILLWMIGSLNGRVWTHWEHIWPWALLTIPLALFSARLLNILQLGDEQALSLGLKVEQVRLGMFFVAVMLTAGAVAVVAPAPPAAQCPRPARGIDRRAAAPGADRGGQWRARFCGWR
jgi:iron complex transport system permease protein